MNNAGLLGYHFRHFVIGLILIAEENLMSAKSLIITSRAAAPAEPGQAVARGVLFELPRAKNFIEKSLSEDTRRAYTRALLDFFSFIRKESPLAQTDDNPDRVSEIVRRSSS
jgi:hypothetical protein